MIHPLSDVKTAKIGSNTKVWQYCVIFEKAVIGDNCNICSHVLIEDEVLIGDNVTVKSGVQLWNGITVEDDVFIGPNATFTNDLIPRSKSSHWNLAKTVIKKGASIGANVTIIAGNLIGEYSLIGAGSVVTKSVPPNTVWYGNPAKQHGFITRSGIQLDIYMKDADGNAHELED